MTTNTLTDEQPQHDELLNELKRLGVTTTRMVIAGLLIQLAIGLLVPDIDAALRNIATPCLLLAMKIVK